MLDARERSRSLHAFALVSRAWHAMAQPMLDSMMLITPSSSQHRAIRRLLKAGRGDQWRWVVADYASAWRDNLGHWRWKQLTAADKATYKLTLAVLAAAVDVRCVTLPLSNDLAPASIPASCTDLRVGAITQAIIAAHRDPSRIESLTFEAYSYWSDHETMPLHHSLDRLAVLSAADARMRIVPFLQAASNVRSLRLGMLGPIEETLCPLAECTNVAAVSATVLVAGGLEERWMHDLVTRLPGRVATVSLRIARPWIALQTDATPDRPDRSRVVGGVAGSLARALQAPDRLPALTRLRLMPAKPTPSARATVAGDPDWLALCAVCAKRGVTLEFVA